MSAYKKIVFWFIIFFTIILYLICENIYSNNKNKEGGETKLEIAKWQFNVTDGEKELQTIELKNTYEQNTLVNGKIAPGTSGKFDIVLDARDGETDLNYAIRFKEINAKPKNLQFIYNGIMENSINNLEKLLQGKIEGDDKEKRIKIFTIEWRWEKETGETQEEIQLNNIQDTEDGINLEEYKFDIFIEGSQI